MTEEARQRAGWTRERPTETGWYWWRETAQDFPHAVLVWPGDGDVKLVKGGFWRDAKELDNTDGEWRGPMTPDDGDTNENVDTQQPVVKDSFTTEIAIRLCEKWFDSGARASWCPTMAQDFAAAMDAYGDREYKRGLEEAANVVRKHTALSRQGILDLADELDRLAQEARR